MNNRLNKNDSVVTLLGKKKSVSSERERFVKCTNRSCWKKQLRQREQRKL